MSTIESMEDYTIDQVISLLQDGLLQIRKLMVKNETIYRSKVYRFWFVIYDMENNKLRHFFVCPKCRDIKKINLSTSGNSALTRHKCYIDFLENEDTEEGIRVPTLQIGPNVKLLSLVFSKLGQIRYDLDPTAIEPMIPKNWKALQWQQFLRNMESLSVSPNDNVNSGDNLHDGNAKNESQDEAVDDHESSTLDMDVYIPEHVPTQSNVSHTSVENPSVEIPPVEISPVKYIASPSRKRNRASEMKTSQDHQQEYEEADSLGEEYNPKPKKRARRRGVFKIPLNNPKKTHTQVKSAAMKKEYLMEPQIHIEPLVSDQLLMSSQYNAFNDLSYDFITAHGNQLPSVNIFDGFNGATEFLNQREIQFGANMVFEKRPLAEDNHGATASNEQQAVIQPNNAAELTEKSIEYR